MKNVFEIFKRVYRSKPIWIYIVILSEILTLGVTFVNVYVPKTIFAFLFDEPSYKKAFITMVFYGLTLLILNVVKGRINLTIYRMEEELCNLFSLEMCDVKSSLLLSELESSDTMNISNKLDKYNMSSFLGTLHTIIGLVSNFITIIGLIAIMSRLSIVVGLLVIVILFVNYIVARKMEQEGYKYISEVQPHERKEQYVLNLMSDFGYGKEVRIYNLMPYFNWKYGNVSNDMLKSYRKIFNSNFKAYAFENTTSAIQKVGIYVLLAIEVLKKGLGVGDFTLYFNAINQFSGSINSLLKGYLSLSKMGLYMDDLKKFVSLPRMDDDISKDKVNEEDELYFEFVNVSFKYPGTETYALKNINLKITSGDRLAIVGANGAGKTTLVKLLLRLYNPSEGAILLGGKDIREFKYEEYAKLFSVVFQDYKLFAFPIEENIGLSESIDKVKLNDSIEKSGLRKKINELPLKEKTPLFRSYDDDGVELSGGEAQKLGIARSLYKDSKVVILDEPTAALDPIAEYEIYQHFNMLVEGRTSIYISHRLASTRFSNNIIVLDKGEIVENGNHIALMKKNGLYSEMYNMQAEYYNNSAQEV